MTKLFIAKLSEATGPKPLITVRAAGEGEAKLFLEAAYPDATIEAIDEPADWVSDTDTGSRTGDIREHPGVAWQAPSSLAG